MEGLSDVVVQNVVSMTNNAEVSAISNAVGSTLLESPSAMDLPVTELPTMMPATLPNRDCTNNYNSGHNCDSTAFVPPVHTRSCVLEQYARFPDRRAVVKAILDQALAHGKRAVLDQAKSGGSSFRYICNSPTPCTYFVRVLKSRNKEVAGFFISSLELNHVGCTGTPKIRQLQVLDNAAARRAVTENLCIPSKELRQQVRETQGIEVPLRMSYRVKDRLTDELLSGEGRQNEEDTAIIHQSDQQPQRGFKQIRAMLLRFKELNPHAHVTFDVSPDGEFDRAIVLARRVPVSHNNYNSTNASITMSTDVSDPGDAVDSTLGKRPGKTRCTFCKAPGHNRRTCPIRSC